MVPIDGDPLGFSLSGLDRIISINENKNLFPLKFPDFTSFKVILVKLSIFLSQKQYYDIFMDVSMNYTNELEVKHDSLYRLYIIRKNITKIDNPPNLKTCGSINLMYCLNLYKKSQRTGNIN